MEKIIQTIQHYWDQLSIEYILLISRLLLVFVEMIFTRNIHLNFKKEEALTSSFNFGFNNYLMRPCVQFIEIFLLQLAITYQDSFSVMHLKLPGVWEFLLVFVLYDAAQYYSHYMFHRIPALWEFHKVHHSVKCMTVFADWKIHFVEEFTFFFTTQLPFVFLGFSGTSLMIVGVMTQISSLLCHGDFKIKLKFFSRYINSPHLHLWHHAKDMLKYPGQNIGSILMIWDHMHNTYVYPDRDPEELGFEGDAAFPRNFLRQFIDPFLNLKKKFFTKA